MSSTSRQVKMQISVLCGGRWADKILIRSLKRVYI
jgi:hypothetical protein